MPAALLGLFACFGALAVSFDIAALRAGEDLPARLTGATTVVVWSAGLESADAAQARAAEALAGAPGAGSVTSLEPAASDRLVARALGAPDAAEARLLQVRGASPAALQQALTTQGIAGAAIDRSWRATAGTRAVLIALAAGILVPLLALAGFVLVCAAEARQEMQRNGATVELMRRAGAFDAYVAGLVRARIAGLALTAGLWGAAGAMIGAALLSRKGLADLVGGLARVDVLWPWAVLVAIAWGLGTLAAGSAARGRLKRAA
jgi:cell division transport system permease protein